MEDIFNGQPRDVGVQPCYLCGEPTALFSPHATRKHLEDGILESLCDRIPEKILNNSVYPTNQDWGPRN